MSRAGKILHNSHARTGLAAPNFYLFFMIPKPALGRLCTSMQLMDTTWQTCSQPACLAALSTSKELKLKLSLETRNRGDVMIVHCQGRIVYRDEAAALSRFVGEVLQDTGKVVLDLSGVSSMDSAGIGELALLQTWAQERSADLKYAGPNRFVRSLLDLTNLDSVLEIHSTVHDALAAFQPGEVCADC
jgi:anti-sigma B factor antagonist